MARNTDTIINTTGTTASFNSGDFTPSGDYKGAIFYLSATENSGTATVDIKIQGKSPNGDYYDLPNASFSQVNSTSTAAFTLYPGIAETANSNVSDVLPCTFRAAVTVGGTGNYDLLLEAEYIP